MASDKRRSRGHLLNNSLELFRVAFETETRRATARGASDFEERLRLEVGG